MREAQRAETRSFGWGAGATLAHEARARKLRTPAASGVTAHGRGGNEREPQTKPQATGGREVAALFLRI